MKMLGTDTSPYVRKARLVLLEKNIPHTYLGRCAAASRAVRWRGPIRWAHSGADSTMKPACSIRR